MDAILFTAVVIYSTCTCVQQKKLSMNRPFVTVHAKRWHKSAKLFSRFLQILHDYSCFYLCTKFDRHSSFTFRDIATFIRGRRKSTIAETAIFVHLRHASVYFLVANTRLAMPPWKTIRSNKKCSNYKRKVQK